MANARYGVFRDGKLVEEVEGLRDARSVATALAWGDKRHSYSVYGFRCGYKFDKAAKA